MQVLRTRAGGATAACAILALGPTLFASSALAQGTGAQAPGAVTQVPGGTTASDTPLGRTGNSPTANVTTGQTLSALRDGASAQQGVPVPFSHGRIVRRVDVRINGGVGYDTNATRSSRLRPIPSDLRKRDFFFPVGVDVDLVLPSGANTYSLSGRVGYDFNLHNTRLNSENIGLSGNYRRAVGRCSAGLDGGFARSRTQFNEAGFVDLRKNLQTTESIGVSVNCDITSGWRPFASFNYIHADNSTARRSYSDHDTKTFGGGLVATLGTYGDVGVVGSIEDTNYPNRLGGGPVGATHLRVKSIGVTFARETARILQARLQLNYTSVDDGLASGSFSGLSGNALVRFMPGSRFVFTGTASRTASPSLSLNSDYDLTTSYGLDAAVRINERAQARVGYEHVHRKLFGAIGLPGELLTRDDLSSIDGGFNYLLNRRISLFFSVVHQRRTANNPIYNYSGTRATIGANVRL